jgi:hypothetical protein
VIKFAPTRGTQVCSLNSLYLLVRFVDLFEVLIQHCLHAMKSGGSFGKAGLLFQRLTVVFCRVQVSSTGFVNPAEVEMWKRVGFVTRRIEGSFEPANAAICIALC